MMFKQSMYRLSGMTLFFTLCGASSVCLSAVRYPVNPTSQSQCDAATEQWSAEYRREQEASARLIKERNAYRAPSGCFGNDRCRDAYYERVGQFHKAIQLHQNKRDNIEREGRAGEKACRTVARAHEQLAEQQRRMAEQQRRQADENQRSMQRQQEVMDRQRAQQADRERALAAARTEALRSQQRAELERANRQQAQSARNEPRVIAQGQGSYYDPATRNNPRAVQTPQMQAQARIEAEQNARDQRAQEQRAVRDVAGALVAGKNSRARREMLDHTLNPDGTHDPAIDSAVDQARLQNTNINRARKITPIASRAAGDAITSTGAVMNNATGQLDGTLGQVATLNVPAPVQASGNRYEGEIRDGKRNGQGVQTFASGGRYEGEYRDDKRTGRGVYTFPNGDRHEGEYRDGKRNGRGVYTFPNGDRYEGEYRDDKRNGRGVYTYSNGNRYEGEYQDDKRHGRGVLTFSDVERYEGEFRDDKRHGRGVVTFADGRRYEGEFRDGSANGLAVLTFANGARYEGEFRNGKRNGQGVNTLANGQRTEGEHRDDKIFNGKSIDPSGKVLAVYINGEIKR